MVPAVIMATAAPAETWTGRPTGSTWVRPMMPEPPDGVPSELLGAVELGMAPTCAIGGDRGGKRRREE